MRLRLGIRNKLVLWVLGLTTPVFFVVFTITIGQTMRSSKAQSLELGRTQARTLAGYISNKINLEAQLGTTLAGMLNGQGLGELRVAVDQFDSLFGRVLEHNEDVHAVWAVLDGKRVEHRLGSFHQPTVRCYWKDSSEAIIRDSSLRRVGMYSSADYAYFKEQNSSGISIPYWSLGSDREDAYVSLHAPLRNANRLPQGLVGVTVPLAGFVNVLEDQLRYEEAFALLVNDDMEVLVGTQPMAMGRKVWELPLGLLRLDPFLPTIREGKPVETEFVNSISAEADYLFTEPVVLEGADKPLALMYVVPRRTLFARSESTITLAWILALLSYAFFATLVLYLFSRLGRVLGRINRNLGFLAHGHLRESRVMALSSNDELGEIAQSMNRLYASLEEKVRFAEDIGRGKLDTSLSGTEDDVLGQSLQQMQKSIQESQRRERLQKRLDSQRAWAREGTARFAEWSHYESSDISAFAYHIIKELAAYTGAEIAALYIRQTDAEGETFYQLEAAYAYQVRKYAQQRVYPGESLVGRCAMERGTIYFSDVPDQYVKIASGLGQSRPDALLLVPAIMNETVEAVIELAGFGGFESYVIQFIESIAGNLASTIVTLRNDIENNKLLEVANVQREELTLLQREMDEKVRDLVLAQARHDEQERRYRSLQHAIRTVAYMVEYDAEGNVVYANEAYLSLLGISLSEMRTRTHAEDLEMLIDDRELDRFWDDLRAGKPKRNVVSRLLLRKRTVTLLETYTPINQAGKPVGQILKIAVDISRYLDGGKGGYSEEDDG
ncbi:MAG: hypothetical protein CSA07_04775 [Bacteroidia bacterium]|nr:MAG: hypothetical protein CSA07_04775 [Bacteroidia bacterium]